MEYQLLVDFFVRLFIIFILFFLVHKRKVSVVSESKRKQRERERKDDGHGDFIVVFFSYSSCGEGDERSSNKP